jgi:hypothetical protein
VIFAILFAIRNPELDQHNPPRSCKENFEYEFSYLPLKTLKIQKSSITSIKNAINMLINSKTTIEQLRNLPCVKVLQFPSFQQLESDIINKFLAYLNKDHTTTTLETLILVTADLHDNMQIRNKIP